MKMNPKVKKLWVKALRSGQYAPGKNALVTVEEGEDDKFCCLGVLCDLAMQKGIIKPWDKGTISKYVHNQSSVRVLAINSGTSYLPLKVMKWAGLTESDPNVDVDPPFVATLSEFNDNGATQKQIAKVIEDQF